VTAQGVFERWIIGGVVVVAGLYAFRALWSEWRGQNGPDLYRAAGWWPFSLPLWRALVRSGPIGAVEAPLLGGVYLASGVLDIVPSAFATLSLALVVVVALFNRPRFVVAPGLRELPGLIDEWKGAPLPSRRPPCDAR
jgi:hypothetical protein